MNFFLIMFDLRNILEFSGLSDGVFKNCFQNAIYILGISLIYGIFGPFVIIYFLKTIFVSYICFY